MSILKQVFDWVLSFAGLIFLAPLIVILVLISSFVHRTWGVFTQERIGQYGRPFKLYKIRSMYMHKSINVITQANDPHISKFGRFLRTYKLDEMLQFINVLKGEMSLVGPRPDVRGYADKLKGKDFVILSFKPGITGPAQIYFRNEEQLLSQVLDPLFYNDNVLWPKKVSINRVYVENWSFFGDLIILKQTFFLFIGLSKYKT